MFAVLVYVLLAVVVAGGLFLIAARFLPAGEQIAPAVRDEQPWELPAGRAMYSEDVDTVRLPVALRGYRFAETDILLDRLADALRERDAEIARLTTRVVPASAGSDPPTPGQPLPHPGVVPATAGDDAPGPGQVEADEGE